MDHQKDGKFVLTRKLNTFDVTNLVVGAIIGADIYIVVGLSANLIGPASLVAWVLAGVMALVIALSFAYCVTLHPIVGGPYAYVKDVSTPFAGFMVGWSLCWPNGSLWRSSRWPSLNISHILFPVLMRWA